jgi:hypothetical protein
VRHIDHLLGDDPGAGEFELCHGLPGFADAQILRRRTGGNQLVGGDEAVVFRAQRARRGRGEAAPRDPAGAQRREAGFEVDRARRVGERAGGVIHPQRRLLRRRVERDLAERHQNVGMPFGGAIDLARAGDRAGGDRAGGGGWRFAVHVHGVAASTRAWIGPGRGGKRLDRRLSRPYAGMIRIRFLGHHTA